MHEDPDVDSDGKVNLTDLLAVAIAFGSFPEHPRWNLACDFNHDDKVDLDDYLYAAIWFGWYE